MSAPRLSLVPCRACTTPVALDAVFCPKCGAQNPAVRPIDPSTIIPRWALYVVLVVAAILAALGYAYSTCEPTFVTTPKWCSVIGRGYIGK